MILHYLFVPPSLHYAALTGRAAVCRLLVERGADAEARNKVCVVVSRSRRPCTPAP